MSSEYANGIPAADFQNVSVNVFFSGSCNTWSATVFVGDVAVASVEAANDDENSARVMVAAALRDAADYVESVGVSIRDMVVTGAGSLMVAKG